MTTVRPPPEPAAVRAGVGDTVGPDGSRREGSASGPAASASIAVSATAQRPSVEMPMAVMRYFSWSAAARTWAAVVHDTSCSAD